MKARSQTTPAILLIVLASCATQTLNSFATVPPDSVSIEKIEWYVLPDRPHVLGVNPDASCEVERIRDRQPLLHDTCRENNPCETLFQNTFSADRSLPKFVYKLDITNIGTRRIAAVAWEYVFFESDSNKPLQRHRFVSRLSLKPGRSSELAETSLRPPTPVVDAGFGMAGSGKQLREEVRILSVEFEHRK